MAQAKISRDLAVARRHYRRMEQSCTDDKDREQWSMLADSIDSFEQQITATADAEQPGLFP